MGMRSIRSPRVRISARPFEVRIGRPAQLNDGAAGAARYQVPSLAALLQLEVSSRALPRDGR